MKLRATPIKSLIPHEIAVGKVGYSHIYYLAKWAGIFGMNVQQIGAQQRGMSEDEFKELLVRAGAN